MNFNNFGMPSSYPWGKMQENYEKLNIFNLACLPKAHALNKHTICDVNTNLKDW